MKLRSPKILAGACWLVLVLNLTAQPAIGTFPVGSSNAVYNHHVLRVIGGTFSVVLTENIPGAGQLTRSSQTYSVQSTTPTDILSEIRQISYLTAQLAGTTTVYSRTDVFDLRTVVSDTNGVARLITAVSFTLVFDVGTSSWKLPADNTVDSLPVDLMKAGTESYAPQMLTFNDYADMTNVVIRFTDANGVFIKNGRLQRNNLDLIGWYDSANGNDAAFSIKGQKNIFDELEPQTKLVIPLKTLTNGYFGEIIITRTNANGAFVERYRLEDGSRIVAPTTLSLSITNSISTLLISGEPTTRVWAQYSTNTAGAPVWITDTDLILSADGVGIRLGQTTDGTQKRLYRLKVE